MLKDCLMEVVNSKLDIGDLRKGQIRRIIENIDDDQLFYLLSSPNGLIAYDVIIHFIPGSGFRCSNDTSRVGHLPICNIIKKILNKKYQELINSK